MVDLGLGKLLHYISEKSSLNIGKVICFSLSAHIRQSELKEIKKVISLLEM